METRKYIALLSLSITLFLFTSVLFLGNILNDKRQQYLNEQFERMYEDFTSLQTITLLEDYNSEIQCIAFTEKMKELDSYIWQLGEKIDKYRIATEEFQKDEYYLKQKKRFNEYEIFYYLLMQKVIKNCNLTKEPLLFFYRNSAICKKCDDQSFVLSDINDEDDKKGNNDIAIFSFDLDMNITALNVLATYYNLTHLPCLVYDDGTVVCGMQDKNVIMHKLCQLNEKIAICKGSNGN